MTLIGAGALTAAVAGVVSAASGRTLGAKHYVRASATVAKVPSNAGSTHATMPPFASAGQLGLGAPGSAPQSAPPDQPQTQAAAPQSAPAPAQSAPAPAVSGGS